MKRIKILYCLLSLAFLLSAVPCRAQFFAIDIATLESLQSSHKQLSGVLGAFGIVNSNGSMPFIRSVLAQANTSLLSMNRDAVDKFKAVNDSLDKYRKVFDLIDAIARGGYTVINAYACVERSSNSINHVYNMLEAYYNQCVTEYDIAPSDTIILDALRRCADDVYSDADKLIASCSDLLAYASGKLSCTSRDFMVMMDRINESLTSIRFRLELAEYQISHYLALRLGFFKPNVSFRAHALHEITDSTFSRWKSAARRYGSYEPRYYTYD